MAWMREPDRERLRTELRQRLRSPVQLSVSIADGEDPRTHGVLEEVVSLSPLLTLVRTAPTGLDPTIALKGNSRGRVAFVGLPMGYEFPTLIEAIRDVSRGETSLAGDIRSRLAEIRSPRELKVFTTPTWSFCPGVARLAHQIAVETARVGAEVVSVEAFPELARRHGVTSVPYLLIDGSRSLVGSVASEVLVGALLDG